MRPIDWKKQCVARSDISQVVIWLEMFRASWRGPRVRSESEQKLRVCIFSRSIQENYRRCQQKSRSCRYPLKTLFSGRFPVRASIFRHSEICTVIYASNPTGCEKTASDISRVGVWPEIFQASWRGPGAWSESEERVNVCSFTRSIQENYRRCPQKSESCRFTPKTFISGRIPVKANFFRHSDIFPVI